MAGDDDSKGSLLVRAYDDIAHRSLDEVGKAVHRAVNLALKPVNGVLWTAEHALAWLEREAAARLRQREIPLKQIEAPPPLILGAAIAGVQISAGEPELRAMFANLLTASMMKGARTAAHPAFAEIIRQLQPDEARILAQFKLVPHRVHEPDAGDLDVPAQRFPRGIAWPLMLTVSYAGDRSRGRVQLFIDDLVKSAK